METTLTRFTQSPASADVRTHGARVCCVGAHSARSLSLSRRAVAARGLALALGVIAPMAMFSSPAQAAPLTVRGEVVYRERMALPPGARLVVQLADVSRADAPARIIATTQVDTVQGSPIAFVLRTDTRKFAKRRSYAWQARISDARDNVLLINDTAQPWLPGDARPVIIPVTRASAGAAPVRKAQPGAPWGRWVAEDILGGGVVDTAQSVINIAPDGRVTGNGGCNGLNGHARVSGKRMSFGRLASTMMACPPALMTQERKFHEALGQARSFRVEPAQGKLFLLDRDNRVVMRLATVAAPG